jgi:hypothetical protein
VPTRAELQAKIQLDLRRNDVSDEISAAISAAIKEYESERFWFLEGTYTFSTTASTAWYDLPDTSQIIDTVKAQISGNWVPLDERHYSYLDDEDTGLVTGTPAEYARYQNRMRIYPVPNSAYPMEIYFTQETTDPTASESSVWTVRNKGYELIRARAKWDVYLNRLHDTEGAMRASAAESRAYSTLKRKNDNKVMTGKTQKHHW